MNTRPLVIVTLTVATVAAVSAFAYLKSTGVPQINTGSLDGLSSWCPVAAVGGWDRNYLPFGTIYALTDDPDRHYYIVNLTTHATSDQLAKMVCFESEAEAQEAGYSPDPAFIEGVQEVESEDRPPLFGDNNESIFDFGDSHCQPNEEYAEYEWTDSYTRQKILEDYKQCVIDEEYANIAGLSPEEQEELFDHLRSPGLEHVNFERLTD